MDQDYAVLGMHGEDVPEVDKVTEHIQPVLDEKGNQILDEKGQPQTQVIQEVLQRNVVRVRMFIDGQMIDEDFSLPRLITIEEQIDQAAKARIAEIKEKGTDPSLSKIVPEQTEQIVEDIK